MNYLISVIVPTYNIEAYISRCLDSIINQTYPYLDIIVIDDGSIDRTGYIIDNYLMKDRRIRTIHKKNEGVSKARLAGLKIANGDYIGFVDGDDIIDNDMFQSLIENAIEYNADISHCGYVMDFPDGHSDYYYNTNKKIIQNHQDGLKDLLSGRFIEPGLWNKIYKKELINKLIFNRKMDYSIKNMEDLLMNYYLFDEAKISIYEDFCKYHYTLRKSSAATSIRKEKYDDSLKVMHKIFLLTRKNQDLNKIAYKNYIRCLINNSIQKDFQDIKKQSKYYLKKEVKNFKAYCLPKKEICMSIGVVYFQPLYLLVKNIYNKITNIDKMYDIKEN